MEKNSKLIKPCNICENDATCLCFDCLNYFCESCYKLIHDKKKKEHKKEKADPFVPIEIKCPEHPNGIMDFFCIQEKGKILIYNILIIFFNYRIMLCLLLCKKYA